MRVCPQPFTTGVRVALKLLKLARRIYLPHTTQRHRSFSDGGNGYVVPRRPVGSTEQKPSEGL